MPANALLLVGVSRREVDALPAPQDLVAKVCELLDARGTTALYVVQFSPAEPSHPDIHAKLAGATPYFAKYPYPFSGNTLWDQMLSAGTERVLIAGAGKPVKDGIDFLLRRKVEVVTSGGLAPFLPNPYKTVRITSYPELKEMLK
ncbi:MAG: hypothetical protein Q7S65_05025 [Nanoarchaeota archaeon]|nr:hypothetical protein [Nanoarchaeota archaeon]